MLKYVLFDVSFFDGEADRANSQKRVLCLLEALTWINQIYLREHPEAPLIYQSGIVYKAPAQFEVVPEVALLRAYLDKHGPDARVSAALDTVNSMIGGERFREVPRIIENGGGDCDNCAAWRCAELRERLGVDAKPYITWRKRADGGTTYHVIVRWPDGASEDPSLLLGMGGPERDADREHEFEKLGERTAMFVQALARTRNVASAIEGAAHDTVLGSWQPSLQDTLPFQNDESYADWSPTRPQAFYANPLFPNLPTTKGGGPIFNTRLRDPDDDFDDRFDGEVSEEDRRKVAREIRRAMKRRA